MKQPFAWTIDGWGNWVEERDGAIGQTYCGGLSEFSTFTIQRDAMMRHYPICELLFVIILFITGSEVFAQKCENLHQFENAYKANSRADIDAFFSQWQKESVPYSATEIAAMDDTLRQAHAIFKAFYTIDDTTVQAGNYSATKYLKRIKYIIVEDSIRIQHTNRLLSLREADSFAIGQYLKYSKGSDSENRWEIMHKWNGKLPLALWEAYGPYDELEFLRTSPIISHRKISFRPSLKIKGKKVLYQPNSHAAALYCFAAGSCCNSTGIDSLEQQKREDFLHSIISTSHTFFARALIISSEPSISTILFDNSLQRAMVYWSRVPDGGIMLMERDGNKWKAVYSRTMWSE